MGGMRALFEKPCVKRGGSIALPAEGKVGQMRYII